MMQNLTNLRFGMILFHLGLLNFKKEEKNNDLLKFLWVEDNYVHNYNEFR